MRSNSRIMPGQYLPGNSLFHRLDPRTKLGLMLLCMTAVLVSRRLEAFFLMSGIVFVLFHEVGLTIRHALVLVRPFLWLLVITMILHGFLTDSGPAVRLPGLGWTLHPEGFRTGAYYGFRIIILIWIAALITLTTAPMAFTDAFEKSLNPLKRLGVPVHEMAMMIAIAIRFIPILLEEADRIRKAQISRGASFDGPLWKRLRGLMALLIPLFVSVFRKSTDLALAMDARCYRGGDAERTSYHQLTFHRRDVLAGLIGLTVSVIIAALG